MAQKSTSGRRSAPGSKVPASKSDVATYAHAGSGDIKAGKDQPGINALPDGGFALTARFIQTAYMASQVAKSRGHGRVDMGPSR